MKRMWWCLVVVAVLAGVVAVVAQPLMPGRDLYIVQKGDTLFSLEGNYTGKPWQWSRLVSLNPFLKNPGRIWADEKGRTIVLIRPGEKLNGLGELGIVPRPFPLERLRAEAPKPAPTPAPASRDYSWLWWLWMILAVLILSALIAYRRMRRDPVTAGPAVVRGGVTDATATNQFRKNISRATEVPIDRIEIRNPVRGYVYGAVNIRYRDGSSRRMVLTGQVGYRAMVRRSGDSWAEEYMLQGCGNDLRMSGAQYIPGFGFRFVPAEVVEEAPQPVPAQPEPATAPTRVEGEKYFTFRPAAGGRPNFVDFRGFSSFEVEVRDGRTMVRFS